jgi:hypothetical protein
MASSRTIERSGRPDWTLMTAIHDALRRDLDELITTTASSCSQGRRTRCAHPPDSSHRRPLTPTAVPCSPADPAGWCACGGGPGIQPTATWRASKARTGSCICGASHPHQHGSGRNDPRCPRRDRDPCQRWRTRHPVAGESAACWASAVHQGRLFRQATGRTGYDSRAGQRDVPGNRCRHRQQHRHRGYLRRLPGSSPPETPARAGHRQRVRVPEHGLRGQAHQ